MAHVESNVYARRCPVHGTVISSPCGNFDGLCGQCELECDMADMADTEVAYLARPACERAAEEAAYLARWATPRLGWSCEEDSSIPF